MTLKVGMVGLDTSHCQAFAKLLNEPGNEFHIPGCRTIKAFPGGSDKFSLSKNRIGQITKDIRGMDIEIVNSIDAIAGLDAYFLESVDGDQHLEQFKILAGFGKPVFIDKPFACKYSDAKLITEIAKNKNIPVMTASAIRYAKGIDELLEENEKVESCEAFGPMALLEDYRDYFWYGIHSAEVLFSFMGKGCTGVQAIHTDNFDLIAGVWNDGRIGSLMGNRVKLNSFGCTLVTNKTVKTGIASVEIPYYALLLKKVVPFFETGKSPIDIGESLEIIAFLDAASRSLASEGKYIKFA